ncbi:MAG: LLM class flavin-dependent oxidoreductase [Pseudonocardiaceae bacterium]|nr:LLM class flavin-dependent oxidoreductase [Pseudonocardiaceae bacterium]
MEREADGMRFGIFYERQLPRPWQDGAEQRMLADALAQVEIADRVGIDYLWEVEHHFLEEYSHSSAPEVFLAAASQRTSRIRLGHGIVQVPHPVNHPARVAERIATLDLISGGRVEFGTGEASSAAELGGFGVPRSDKRAMWHESVDTITRMFVEEPFAGADGQFVRMPPRNVIPKPAQRPHPPLWVACSRRETIQLAARTGMGALSFSFVEPEDAGKWVREYYDLLTSEECVPAGFTVNPNLAVVVPMMIHHDEAEAIERGIDGAHFFGFSLAHYYGAGNHHPGITDVWQEFGAGRADAGFARHIVTPRAAPLGVRMLQQGMGSLRGAIGTPTQVTELVARYEAAGVDQVIFVLQAGPNRHEHVCESLELFGAEVAPRFLDGREERERAKAERLAPAVDKAMARRAPARSLPGPYRIDEEAELARARRAALPGLRELAGNAVATARDSTLSGLARLVAGTSDAQLERYVGNRGVQQVMFNAMARSYNPALAPQFTGTVCYQLRPTHGEPRSWTIEVRDGRATARVGDAPDPAVLVRLSVADFARLAAGSVTPMRLLLEDRILLEGDPELAYRIGEMFGGPSPF